MLSFLKWKLNNSENILEAEVCKRRRRISFRHTLHGQILHQLSTVYVNIAVFAVLCFFFSMPTGAGFLQLGRTLLLLDSFTLWVFENTVMGSQDRVSQWGIFKWNPKDQPKHKKIIKNPKSPHFTLIVTLLSRHSMASQYSSKMLLFKAGTKGNLADQLPDMRDSFSRGCLNDSAFASLIDAIYVRQEWTGYYTLDTSNISSEDGQL